MPSPRQACTSVGTRRATSPLMTSDRGIAAALQLVTAALGDLVAAHVTHAKAELRIDLHAVSRRGLALLVWGSFVAIGYVCLVTALAVALVPLFGTIRSLCLLGVLHFGGGCLGGCIALR